MEARKKVKMEVARDSMTVREIVINTQPFLGQLVLPEDRRNQEVVRKSWSNIFEILEGQEGRWASVIPNFKPLYEFMCGEGNWYEMDPFLLWITKTCQQGPLPVGDISVYDFQWMHFIQN